jgi:hypothetical protein
MLCTTLPAELKCSICRENILHLGDAGFSALGFNHRSCWDKQLIHLYDPKKVVPRIVPSLTPKNTTTGDPIETNTYSMDDYRRSA